METISWQIYNNSNNNDDDNDNSDSNDDNDNDYYDDIYIILYYIYTYICVYVNDGTLILCNQLCPMWVCCNTGIYRDII
jgi:hypothetical protein